MAEKYDSLAHTKYYTRYHIVFTPKYRRKVIYNPAVIKRKVGKKNMFYIFLSVSIPPKYSVSEIMGYLKGKSAMMIFEYHANLKYKFGNRHFWAEGYYVSTVGLNESTVRKYIQDQEKDDIAKDKLSVKEYEDPFGEDKENRKENKNKKSK